MWCKEENWGLSDNNDRQEHRLYNANGRLILRAKEDTAIYRESHRIYKRMMSR